MVIDMTVLLAWMIALWTIFNFFELPRWLLYIVLFVGVIFYSRITPTWERPYRSPDIDKERSGDR